MRAQQKAAPTSLEHLLQQWQANDCDFETAELAGGHIDAIENGRSKAAHVRNDVADARRTSRRCLEELGRGAPGHGIGEHEVQNDGVEEGAAQ